MMTNVTCKNFDNSSFYLRSNCKDPADYLLPTLWIFVSQALVSSGFAVITFMSYNSIRILNLNIHIDAISNTWWILYFLVSALRLVHCGSQDLITKEIDRVGRDEKRSKRNRLFLGFKRTLSSSGLVFCTFAVVTVASIIISCVLISTDNAEKSSQQYFFWIYVGSISLDGLASLFLVYFATDVKSSEGPRLMIKIMFILAVLLSLPSDLPFYIWRNCIFEQTFCFLKNTVSFYDCVILLDVLSSFLFFLIMRLEYIRLKQECEWAMLNEVQRFSF